MKFLSKHFTENGKEKLFPNNSSLLSNLKNTKTNTVLSWELKFNTFLQSYLPVTSNVPHFSIKKESGIIMKMTDFWRKHFATFNDVKKIEIYFSNNTFVSYICWQRYFFPVYTELELKTFFIIFDRFFEW